jgi:hypothetical protein
MTAANITAAEGKAVSDANRQRRAHKKSRRGCSSCKLRRVKCDERRPGCARCKDFGVACTYDGKVSSLSFAGESSFSLNDLSAPNHANTNKRDHSLDVVRMQQLSRSQRLSESSAVLAQLTGLPSPPDSDGGNSSYAVGRSELEIFQRFNERTVLSVGSASTSKIYQREIIQLACSVGRAPRTPKLKPMALIVGLESFFGTHRNSSDLASRSPSGRDECHQPQDSIALVSWHCKVQRSSNATGQGRESRRSLGQRSSDGHYSVRHIRGSNTRGSLAAKVLRHDGLGLAEDVR